MKNLSKKFNIRWWPIAMGSSASYLCTPRKWCRHYPTNGLADFVTPAGVLYIMSYYIFAVALENECVVAITTSAHCTRPLSGTWERNYEYLDIVIRVLAASAVADGPKPRVKGLSYYVMIITVAWRVLTQPLLPPWKIKIFNSINDEAILIHWALRFTWVTCCERWKKTTTVSTWSSE